VSKRSVANLQEEVSYAMFGGMTINDEKGVVIRELPNTAHAIAASCIISDHRSKDVFQAFENSTRYLKHGEFAEYYGAQILIRACEKLQINNWDFQRGAQQLCSYVPVVSLNRLINALRPVKVFDAKLPEKHMSVLKRLGTRMLSIVGWYRKPTAEDLEASAISGFGLFLAREPYNVVFGATMGDGKVVPVFLRSFYFQTFSEKAVSKALKEIENQAQGLGAESHVALIFRFSPWIEFNVTADKTSPRQTCFQFYNPHLSHVLHQSLGPRQIENPEDRPIFPREERNGY
jgi:hypothetical protein